MSNIKVVNTRTLGGGVRKLIGLGALVAGIYFLGPKFSNGCGSIGRTSDVEAAIKSKDVALASRLLKAYQRDLSRKDFVRFNLDIDRINANREFGYVLRTGGEDAATQVLHRFENIRLFSDKTLDRFRRDIYRNSERGLFDRLDRASLDERIELSMDYLRFYPNGLHRSLVVQHLVVDNFSRLVDYFDRGADYEVTRRQVDTLKSILHDYQNDRFPLESLVPIAGVVEKANKYVDRLVSVNPHGEVRRGSVVRTVHVDYQNVHYRDIYLALRDKIYLNGSIGEVVGVFENSACVRFRGIRRRYSWGNFDYCKKYWKNKQRNVAGYETEELVLLSPLNEIDKNVLRHNIEELRASYTNYVGRR